jgi:serine/threonine-protein kinase
VNQPRATLAAGMQVTPSVRLVSPLGAGGMGAVWLAEHTALNTRVVVKFMLVGLDSSTSARTRFKREAEAASQVKSPHVVQTFDYGVTTDGLPFIVMEHLEGRDLGAEITARGALPPAMVITIVAQVAKALSKAHAAGLLHRDIKPDNIFLCQGEAEDELFVKLLDFGIAKTHNADGEASLDGQTKTGQVIGTPFYMSPEQVTAQKVIDLRSDLWSLGIVAYEALTGKRPFDGPSFGALAVKIATGGVPRPSDDNPALPPSVDAWFAQACAREPSARFATARELAERLRGAFEGVVSLPPIASGGMADSGPRTSASSARSSQATIASAPPGPISVDDDAHARPSFVLASTLEPEAETSGDRSALARSEPGGDDRPGDARARRGPPGRVKLIAPLVALGIITLAIAAGWKAKEHSDDAPSVKNATALPAPASAAPPPAVASTAATPATPSTALPSVPEPPPSASGRAVSAASAPPSARATSATTAAPRATAAHAPAATAATASTPSTPSTPTAARSAKPLTSSEPAPRPSARPTSTSDDPLF